jgi:23S rRNA pseudouridine1911/1915/1917 synthase
MEEVKYHFVVAENQAKIRLDRYLTLKIADISRSRLQKLIQDAYVTVNGKAAKASHLILPHECIEVIIPKAETTDIIAQEIPLKIVYEDNHLLVIDKPAGLVVHPAYGNMSGTLVNALLYHCKELSGVGGVKRPGIVHRLDKDTSGLLVVAKDDYTHQQLSLQFSKRQVDREYQALAWGHFKKWEGRIEGQIARSRTDRTKMTVHATGKIAITNYKVIKQYSFLALLTLKLGTGRTHQIRVHLSSIGHPIMGDKTYGGCQKQVLTLNQNDRINALELLQLMPRQALHARILGFVHPMTKETLRFNSELPDDMRQLLYLLEQ